MIKYAVMLVTTFRPLAKAKLYRSTGYTIDGTVELGTPVEIGIAPVRLNSSVSQTSIRTDKSGSKARAEEVSYDARILIVPDAEFTHGDIIELFGLNYRIEVIFPRHEMTGQLNHYQVDLIRWSE